MAIDKNTFKSTVDGHQYGYYRDDLQCSWLSVEILPPNGIRINMEKGHCVDWRGAVRFARMLVDDVEVIETWADGERDTCYRWSGKAWKVTHYPE